jgi:hypothetical protein
MYIYVLFCFKIYYLIYKQYLLITIYFRFLIDLKNAEGWSDKEEPDSTKGKERDVSKYQFSVRLCMGRQSAIL